nr:acetyl-CoA C-acyltransferase [Kofleriaceae bacterium]
MLGTDCFVVATARTPRGKGSPKGALHGVLPVELVAELLRVIAARGVRASEVDDVVIGCATQVDDQGANLARTATLVAGWDARVPGATVNRFCASGLDAIGVAAARVRAGDAALVVAGGVESVSRVPMLADRGPLYGDPAIAARIGAVHMGVSADLIASLDGATRDACDAYADASRRKARAARPPPSLVPMHGLDRDELVGRDPDGELPPLFADRAADIALARARYPQVAAWRAVHTRGSSPQLADAAAVVALADRATADRLGLPPRARVVATATCAVDPVIMLTAGQLAAERALARAGLAARDVAVFEFAEAFAATCLRFMRAFDLDHERMNPNGGTIARGHAFGATGAILAIDVVDELARRGARYGVACVSGAAGLGSAIVLERIQARV